MTDMGRRQSGGVTLRTATSSIVVEPGGLAKLGSYLLDAWPRSRRVFVITDEHLATVHLPALLAALEHAGLAPAVHAVPAGEASKSLDQAERLYDWLAGQRAERRDPVLAFGGGVVGDLAGFVAATYLRGMPLVQIPTTLLAMVDSSVGGKTGINLPAGKNLVGAFYQPARVLVDPALARTLPARELRSGWAEVIKYAFLERSVPGLEGSELYDLLTGTGDRLRALAEPETGQALHRCIALKARVVELDERESDLRRILNLGHTIGHAVEAVAGYGRYAHGEAVALGLVGVTRLAARLGLCDDSLVTAVSDLRAAFALPQRIEGCAIDALLARMAGDKKVAEGRIHWVLPRELGVVEVRDDVPLAAVRAVLAELGATPR